MQKTRLDKMLASALKITRSQASKFLKTKQIKVNDIVVTHNIDVTSEDVVTYQNTPISKGEKYVYYALNKPEGYICANDDRIHSTVFDILGEDIKNIKGIHTVGRLDKDTTGLLLITNDGELTHELLAPKKHVDKRYLVTLKDPCLQELVEVFAKGFALNDEKIKPSKLEIINPTYVSLTISEGKYHQVKRMFAKFGNEVVGLHRDSFGKLTLQNINLKKGEWKELKKEEIL
ncbi:pseudouridine synthase [Mycoplasma sp. 48589B]